MMALIPTPNGGHDPQFGDILIPTAGIAAIQLILDDIVAKGPDAVAAFKKVAKDRSYGGHWSTFPGPANG